MCVRFSRLSPPSLPPKPRAGARPARGRLPPRNPIALRSLMLRRGRRCARWRIEEAALGPLFRRWGVGRGERAGLQSVATGYRRAEGAAGVAICFRVFPSCRPAPQEKPRWAAWLKGSLPWTGRRSAPYGNAEKKRNPFGRNSVLVRLLFGIVPVCSASSFEVKLMEEFLKHSEIAMGRSSAPTVGGHLRQIATHCGDLRHQPKPRRHSAADNGSVHSRDLRKNRETSPGEIHGA